MWTNCGEFFEAATGKEPYDYQQRLADEGRRKCWPWRFVYCLPMQVVLEHTQLEVAG